MNASPYYFHLSWSTVFFLVFFELFSSASSVVSSSATDSFSFPLMINNIHVFHTGFFVLKRLYFCSVFVIPIFIILCEEIKM